MKSYSPSSRLSIRSCGRRRNRLLLSGIALTTLAVATFQLPRILATCPPQCGLLFAVNTTFDATTGADDVFPGDGVCETASGNGVCTLRAAIEEANAYSQSHGGVSDGIGFNIPTTDPNYNGISWTINLTGGLPDLSTNMDIFSPGPNKLRVKRNTAAIYRIFNVTTAGTVTFSGLTINNGNVAPGSTGGGIANSTGTVNVTNCTISGNSAKNGAGIVNSGTMTFTSCTLSGNTASNRGGGIQNFGTATFTNCTISGNTAANNDAGGIDNSGTSGAVNLTNCTISGNSAPGATYKGGGIVNLAGTMNVTNCTISGNSAANLGGGIYSNATTTNVKSSIIALNTAGASGPDVNGSFNPQGFNLIGKNDGAATSFPAGNPNANNDIVGTSASPVDPKLDPSGLANNGGLTLTIALISGSPAIDKGTSVGSTGTLTSDQRGPGYSRTVNNLSIANAAGGDGTDVGAFEFGVTIRLISIARDVDDIVVTFQAAQGATYRLERRDIADPTSTWQSISGVNDLTPGSNGPASITDPGVAVSLGKASYRVRLL